jgi:hypothetical protein
MQLLALRPRSEAVLPYLRMILIMRKWETGTERVAFDSRCPDIKKTLLRSFLMSGQAKHLHALRPRIEKLLPYFRAILIARKWESCTAAVSGDSHIITVSLFPSPCRRINFYHHLNNSHETHLHHRHFWNHPR